MRKGLFGWAVIAALSLASIAQADEILGTIEGHLYNVSPGGNGTVYAKKADNTWGSAYCGIGQLDWTRIPADSKSPTFWTYCIQINNEIGWNTYKWDVHSELAAVQDIALFTNNTTKDAGEKAAALEGIFGYVRDMVAPSHDITQLSNNQAAALQLVVWEVVYNGVPDALYNHPGTLPTSGTPSTLWTDHNNTNFYVDKGGIITDSTLLIADGFLNQWESTSTMTLYGLDGQPYAAQYGGYQNQAITGVQYAPPAAPMPASAWMGLALLGALGASKARRSRKS